MLKEQINLMEEQIVLRRESAKKERFKIAKQGREAVYADFLVANPKTEGEYKVAIRGFAPGDNYCSCPDFRKNTLGTCKHIEATLLHLKKTVGQKRLARKFVPRTAEVYLHYGQTLSVRLTLPKAASAELQKIARRYFTADGVFREGKLAQFPKFLEQIDRIDDRAVVYRDAMEHVERELDLMAGLKEEAEYRKRLARGEFGKGLLKLELHPYQKEGVIFAACRRRCILGDDMGLGKTAQAIGAAQLLIDAKGVERILVVCPASLKHQWKQEIERFSDNAALVVDGDLRARKRLYESGPRGFLIATYEAVRADVEAVNAWAPDLIVLDEAQRIKNWESQTAKKVKRLRSPYAFVLTGTPMENKLDELYSIVEFVDDRRLGPAFQFLADHTVYEKDSKTRVAGYKGLDLIRAKLSPILLRRTKAEMLSQLPPRTVDTYYVEMTKEQSLPYAEQEETVGRIVAKWRRQGWLSEFDHRRLLCALTNMRMLCDSTFLYDKKTNFSPKLDELRHIVGDAVENRGKVVVFSQWTTMLEKVAETLRRSRLKHVYLHGGVPSRKRGAIVREFWDDRNVKVFLSSDAGGVGLNLQAGSTVVNVEIPWNSAVLEQRVGRVHRMGQASNVHVVNMVTRQSIEERILGLIERKKALFDGVFEGTCDSVDFKTSSKSVFKELVNEMVEEKVPAAGAAAAPPALETPGGPPAVAPALEMDAFARLGMDLLGALAGALATRETRAVRGAAKIVTDPNTGSRRLELDLPPDDALKPALKMFGQMLVRLGS